jgi:hypothetical protein
MYGSHGRLRDRFLRHTCICEHFKDPSQNGGRNLDQIIEHVRETPLVLWGWNPGDGRTPVPISHDDFVRDMTDWVKHGAACPE